MSKGGGWMRERGEEVRSRGRKEGRKEKEKGTSWTRGV